MMKKIMILCIRFYRSAISPHMRPCCRYTPTCSAYALEAIEKYGAWKGGWLAVKRIRAAIRFRTTIPMIRCPDGKRQQTPIWRIKWETFSELLL